MVNHSMTTRAVKIVPRTIVRLSSKSESTNRRDMCNVRKDLVDIFLKSVKSVQPITLLQNRVQLLIDDQNKAASLRVCGDDVELSGRKVRVLGFGKAVIGMATEIGRILGEFLHDGILIAPAGTLAMIPNISNKFIIMEGAINNIADVNSVKASRMALNYVRHLDRRDLLLVLISGGGSALLSLPVDGVYYREKSELIKRLADRGARIDEMNIVRKKLSAVKGGKLAQAAQPAQVVALTLSDVIGDRLDVIASGPTVPNDDDVDAAMLVLEKFGLDDELSPIMRDHVYNTREIEQYDFRNAKTYLIGNNEVAAEAAATEALAKGYAAIVMCNTLQGDVVNISKMYAEIAKQTKKYLNGSLNVNKYSKNLKDICKRANEELNVEITVPKDLESRAGCWPSAENGVCLIFAGEPTVRVNQDADGIGGRSQHLALLFSQDIKAEVDGEENADCSDIWLLCGGTDGADGPTDAAGAVACSRLVELAKAEGLNVAQALAECNSYGFLSRFDGGDRLIKTGHTGTNVMDLHFLLIRKSD